MFSENEILLLDHSLKVRFVSLLGADKAVIQIGMDTGVVPLASLSRSE